MDHIYKDLEEYNPNQKHKRLIIFDDINPEIFVNRQVNPAVTELFIRSRKLNISLVFITKSYFAVPKDIRLTSMHYFVMKILNKAELQQLSKLQ